MGKDRRQTKKSDSKDNNAHTMSAHDLLSTVVDADALLSHLDVLLEESPPTQSSSRTFLDEDDYSEQQKEFEKVKMTLLE